MTSAASIPGPTTVFQMPVSQVSRRIVRPVLSLVVFVAVGLLTTLFLRRRGSTRGVAIASSYRPAWVVPDATTAPHDYPVKAKVASGVYHVPGQLNYARTIADRCYHSAAAAEADGFRAAKR